MLKIENISVKYGAVTAVKKIDLVVNRGELVTLLGANGAGKSSTLLAISGAIKCTQGSIIFNEHNITTLTPEKIIRLGIAMVPETRDVFPDLTTHENLKLGAFIRSRDKIGVNEDMEKMFALFPILKKRLNQSAGTLSGGEQQMLAMGRALARDIKLLLLDEPYEGLAPVIVQEIEKTLRLIREQGITTIIVEQNAVAALKLADRAVILDTGGVVFSGTAKEVLENEELRHEYLAI